MSLTATTRMPADDSRKASGPPTLPNPCTTARQPTMGMSSSRKATRAHVRQPDEVAPECPRVPPMAIGVDVGRRYVAVGAEQRADLVGVAPGHTLELAERQAAGVAAHATLGPAERELEEGGLEGHHRRQRLDLLDVEGGVEADAALAGATGRVVVDPPTREDLDGAVVEPHGNRDLERALRRAQHA